MARRLPPPPSTFRTERSTPTAEDLQDIRRYLEQLTRWLTDLEADVAAGGGGGAIESVNAGPGIIVADPTGPNVTVAANVTKTDVGLGNVDNVKQLAYDVTVYGPKSPVAGSEQMWVSDAGTVKRANLSDLAALANLHFPAPWTKRRSAPSAIDDEFDSGSPDLAVRGWRIGPQTSSTVWTRNGNVSLFSNSGDLPANTYNSTLVDSVLFIQVPKVNTTPYDILISKQLPVTPTNSPGQGVVVWAKWVAPDTLQASKEHASASVQLAYNHAATGSPDSNNRTYTHSWMVVSGSNVLWQYARGFLAAGSGSPTGWGFDHIDSLQGDVVVNQLEYLTATSVVHRSAWVNSASNRIVTGLAHGNPINLTLSSIVHVGPGFYSGGGGPLVGDAVSYVYALDYVRVYQGAIAGFFPPNS